MNEQLAGDRDESHLLRLSGSAVALVNLSKMRIVAFRDNGSLKKGLARFGPHSPGGGRGARQNAR